MEKIDEYKVEVDTIDDWLDEFDARLDAVNIRDNGKKIKWCKAVIGSVGRGVLKNVDPTFTWSQVRFGSTFFNTPLPALPMTALHQLTFFALSLMFTATSLASNSSNQSSMVSTSTLNSFIFSMLIVPRCHQSQVSGFYIDSYLFTWVQIKWRRINSRKVALPR